MNAHSPSRVFEILLLLVCRNVIRNTDCLVLNLIYKPTFTPYTRAKFECVIKPFSGIQKWYVDSAKVAECSFYACRVKDDNQGSYSFTNDSSSGIFTFMINPETLADNVKVVGCSDGATTESKNITVTALYNDGNRDDDGWNLYWLACFCAIPLPMVVLIHFYILLKKYPRFIETKSTDSTIYLKWDTLTYPCCLVETSVERIACKQITKTEQAEKDLGSNLKNVTGTETLLRNLDQSTEYEITLHTNRVFLRNSFRFKKKITTTVKTTVPAPPKCDGDSELAYLIPGQSEEEADVTEKGT